MKCPKCDEKMLKVGEMEIHNNPTDGKEYERQMYKCEGCDVWVTFEEPKLKLV